MTMTGVLATIFAMMAASGHSEKFRSALQADLENAGEDGGGTALIQRLAREQGQSPSKAPIRSLVINLDSRMDRWAHMQEELKPLEESGLLQVERLAATNGTLLDPLTVSDPLFTMEKDNAPLVHEMAKDWYGIDPPESMVETFLTHLSRGTKWSAGQRGSAISHLRAWREVAQGIEPVLILEDDAVFDEHFAETLLETKSLLSDADILFLQYHTMATMLNLTSTNGMAKASKAFKGEKLANLTNGYNLYAADFLLDIGAYLLWPSGAQTLINNLPFNCSADIYVSMWMHKGVLQGYAVEPLLVKQLYETDMTDPAAMNDIEKLA
mmetsp:Transcript_42417/g.76161  ORF Transcript_42417/g.76161 Transcript_42417/m.76161 type:complete len:325 (-) Transcript_42417:248-1222(-)